MRDEVKDPWGVRWIVWRRWHPWRRRWTFLYGLEVLLNVLAGAASIFALLALLRRPSWLVRGPVFAVWFVVESLLLPLLLPFVALWRWTTGRWPVEVERDGRHIGTRLMSGYAAAGAERARVVAAVRAGHSLA